MEEEVWEYAEEMKEPTITVWEKPELRISEDMEVEEQPLVARKVPLSEYIDQRFKRMEEDLRLMITIRTRPNVLQRLLRWIRR